MVCPVCPWVFSAMNRPLTTVPNKTEHLLVSKRKGITRSLHKRMLKQCCLCVQQQQRTSSSFCSHHKEIFWNSKKQNSNWFQIFFLSLQVALFNQCNWRNQPSTVSTGFTAAPVSCMTFGRGERCRRTRHVWKKRWKCGMFVKVYNAQST